VEVVGEIREKAHDDELGGADAEGCQSERHQRRMQQNMFAWPIYLRGFHTFIAP
jgi:hypothetical protein